MKTNIALTVVTLALAGLCSAISLITVHTAAPALLASHALALSVGVVTLAVMVAMGPARLSSAGLLTWLCVVGLCLCCFIEKSDYGLHQKLTMFGRQILEPAFFLTPSLVLLFAWARQNRRGTMFFATATIVAVMLAVLMPRISEATLVLFLAAALYGLVVRIQNRKTIRCLIAAAIAFSPFVVREVQMQMSGRSCFVPDSLVDLRSVYSCHMVADSLYYCGNWALVVLAVAVALLSVCLVIIASRARTSRQMILATGGTIALIAQTVLGILHFFFLVPRHSSRIPFVSTGNCYTIACFALLGLVLSTLRNDSVATEKTRHSHGKQPSTEDR